ncbi:MAG: polyprenyl synthetase family protein [Gemmataceae bacterium]
MKTASVPKYRSMFEPIADDLAEADRILDEALAGYSDGLAPLTEYLRHYRGTRLRPALLLLTAKACGSVTPAHHTLAAVVEMIHTATLVHDDILDGATTRRHVRTVNAGWNNHVAVLLGDMLFTHSFALTSTVDVRACRAIGETTNRVCAGELRQVAESGNLHLSEADYFELIDGKTAALTECCCRLGALYAGASDELVEKMASYGRNLGLAFQIADDVMDLIGDEGKAGKTLGTDAAQQKLTLPVIHCLGKLPTREAQELRTEFSTPRAAEAIAQAIAKTGSLAHARYRAEECAKAAIAELDELLPSPAKSLLLRLPEWAVQREQ